MAFKSMEDFKFQCENPVCRTIYAEYVNGCPRCSTGEVGGSHSVRPVHSVTHDSVSEEQKRAAEEIVSIVGTKIAAVYGIYYGSVEMVDAFAKALASREQTAAENAARVIVKAIEGAYDTMHTTSAVIEQESPSSYSNGLLKARAVAVSAAAPFLKGK